MDNNNAQQNEQENKLITFLNFLEGYHSVEIPRIQRDYVQGGNDDKAKDIREGFLADLKKAVKKEKKLSLDFIYGVVENSKFLPLDGQQRLTTLFLLYWYGVRQLKDESLREKILKQLEKFSYQTRFSSKDFCRLLFDKSLIGNIVSTESAGDNTASGADNIEVLITDNPQFSRFWRYDPTVDSMLNMLKDIDLSFGKDVQPQQWEKFFENETVSFF